MTDCPDCGVSPGANHTPGCDVERCPNCGHQAISCDCEAHECASLKPIPWSGEWPGVAECREFGWYSRMTKHGWFRTNSSHPEATEDLSRLATDAVWNRDKQVFEPLENR